MNIDELIAQLDCQVVIPETVSRKNLSFKPLVDLDKDKRRVPRFQCEIHAAMQYRRGFPAMRRMPQWNRIKVQNISRFGIGFLHSEPMFPLEQAIVILPGEIERGVEVRRCRRLGLRCFEIGGEFDELLDDRSVQRFQ